MAKTYEVEIGQLIPDDKNFNRGTDEGRARNIVNMISDALGNEVQGMAIVMKGTHLCKTMRGVKSNGQMTVAHLSGIFKENSDARNEFYKLINNQ